MRWKDDDGRIYEWDDLHATVEVYNRRGRHLGERDAMTWTLVKPARLDRRVEP